MPERVAGWALLGLPVALLLGPLPIELCIGAVNAAFVARLALTRDWAVLRVPWLGIAAAWWGWVLICSLPAVAEAGTWPRWTVQALVSIRLPFFALAASVFLAADARLRQRLYLTVAGVAAVIVALVLWQLAGGRNWYGQGMRDNGLLTGPFDRPRAGPVLMHLFFPVLLPLAVLWRGRWMGAVVLAAGVAVMVPVGQRMPLLLVGLGLVVSAWLLPALRRAVVAAVLAGLMMLAAGSVLFPNAQFRLVNHFVEQLAHFPTSHYGLIFSRAAAMVAAHPLMGRGFAGFRTGCGEERYFAPSVDGGLADGGGAGICVTHAHNFYLEAAVDGGVVGLALFVVLVGLWLRAVRPDEDVDRRMRGHDGAYALRLGLFVAALLHLWPVAGANTFTNPYMAGWFFLILGWGLAERKAADVLGTSALRC